MEIDVCMPTWNSSKVLGRTLTLLAAAESSSDININNLIVVDNESSDDTLTIAGGKAEEHSWGEVFILRSTNLPEARQTGIKYVETEWFLFLDDDVRISERYLEEVSRSIAPAVGAIQGRKTSRTESNSDWVRRRARRGGTHGTLIRHDSIAGIQYPSDLCVLEDEYSRRVVEDSGYLWIFNHQAKFTHASMDRHPIGWQEGYLGAKYGLSTFDTVALNVPYAVVTLRNPVPQFQRMLGWIWGYVYNINKN